MLQWMRMKSAARTDIADAVPPADLMGPAK